MTGFLTTNQHRTALWGHAGTKLGYIVRENGKLALRSEDGQLLAKNLRIKQQAMRMSACGGSFMPPSDY